VAVEVSEFWVGVVFCLAEVFEIFFSHSVLSPLCVVSFHAEKYSPCSLSSLVSIFWLCSSSKAMVSHGLMFLSSTILLGIVTTILLPCFLASFVNVLFPFSCGIVCIQPLVSVTNVTLVYILFSVKPEKTAL